MQVYAWRVFERGEAFEARVVRYMRYRSRWRWRRRHVYVVGRFQRDGERAINNVCVHQFKAHNRRMDIISCVIVYCQVPINRRYFQHAHFIPIVGVEKRSVYQLVHGDLPRQHSYGTTLRFTGSVPADSRE